MSKKKTDAVKFGLHMVQLIKLFRRVDKKKWETALVSEDIKKICEVLGVTENELRVFYERGAKLSRNLSGDDLKKAALVFRKSIKK